jgi:hypothetical protein
MINLIVFCVGVATGMWIKSQINEGKNPLTTIKKSVMKLYGYITKKAPKADA